MCIRLFLLWLFSSTVYASVAQTYLPNGLEVLLKPDHRAPVAVVMMWYHVGSADDPSGQTGISHVLEHMMFKGTPRYPQGVFSKTIASLGGQENAFTTHDYTAYFVKISASHLETILKLEADRMQHLSFDQNAFAKEMKVIQEERRMRIEDNPQALAFERFLAAAHLTAPYHQPIIGWMNDLKTLTLKEVKQWYTQNYAPNNATLVIIGDFSSKTLYPLIKKYFGPLHPHTRQIIQAQKEPPALGQKTLKIETKANLPLLIQGYTVPSIKSATPASQEDPYTLELIAALLSAGENGRLQKHIVREKHCASDISAMYDLYTRYESQFTLFAFPTPKCPLKDLKNALKTELSRLQDQEVPMDELLRIKTQLIAQKTFEKDSLLGQATEIGMLAVQNGLQELDRYPKALEKITPKMIQTVAKKYFIDQNRTEAQLVPNHGASQ